MSAMDSGSGWFKPRDLSEAQANSQPLAKTLMAPARPTCANTSGGLNPTDSIPSPNFDEVPPQLSGNKEKRKEWDSNPR